jgi:hypothetical protein
MIRMFEVFIPLIKTKVYKSCKAFMIIFTAKSIYLNICLVANIK